MNSLLHTLFSPEVDICEVGQTLRPVPDYTGYAKTQGFPQEVKIIYAHRQAFELEFRRYLLGETKNLRAVNKQVLAFQSHSQRWARVFIYLTLKQVNQELVAHEYYELLPRFQQAIIKIHCFFSIPELALLIFPELTG